MNKLQQLIEEYERENPGHQAKYEYTSYMGDQEEEWGTGFVNFLVTLASRPTCGIEQRKFLDEIESMYMDDESGDIYCEDNLIIDQNCFESNLEKVIEGE